jgi:organic hydroperoxide reductase OsmC/OhrA
MDENKGSAVTLQQVSYGSEAIGSAHQTCAYSEATRANIDVVINLK